MTDYRTRDERIEEAIKELRQRLKALEMLIVDVIARLEQKQ